MAHSTPRPLDRQSACAHLCTVPPADPSVAARRAPRSQEYEGGGTWFQHSGEVLLCDRGQAVLHAGGDFENDDVGGAAILVRRGGGISFEDKAARASEAGAGLSAAHARAHRVPPREKIAERPQSAPLVARATPSDAAAAEEYPGLYITAEGRARRRRQRAEGTQQLLRWMQSDKPRGGTSLSGSTKESKWRFTALVASLSSAFPLSRATSNS